MLVSGMLILEGGLACFGGCCIVWVAALLLGGPTCPRLGGVNT